MSMPASEGQSNFLKFQVLAQSMARPFLEGKGLKDRHIDDDDLFQEVNTLLVEEIEVKYPGQNFEDFLSDALSDQPKDPEKLTWLYGRLLPIMTAVVHKEMYVRPGGPEGSPRPRIIKGINNVDSFENSTGNEAAGAERRDHYLGLRNDIARLLKHPGLSSKQRKVLLWRYKLSTPKRVASLLEVARAMGIQRSTVRDHWRQIVKRLRENPPTRRRE